MLAQVGGLVLMFIAGLETDIERMREASITAFLVALSGSSGRSSWEPVQRTLSACPGTAHSSSAAH